MRSGTRAQRAGWRAAHSPGSAIGSIRRAGRKVEAAGLQLDIRLDVRGRRTSRRALLVFQRPLLSGAVKLAEVIDASVLLRGGAGFHEVGNRDSRQKTDNGHDDHDFHQGEACVARCSDFHTAVRYFLFLRSERSNRRVTITAFFVHGLPVAPAGPEIAGGMPELRRMSGTARGNKKGPKLSLGAWGNWTSLFLGQLMRINTARRRVRHTPPGRIDAVGRAMR